MDIDKLRLFASLTDTLNFHKCAQTNFISPSTLSRNIQDLEDKLSVKLFERDNRSVALTSRGYDFLVHARQIIQQWDTAKDLMQTGAKSLHGTLSIYCSVTASYSFLFDMLSDFRTCHPNIEIKLHTGDPALSLNRVLTGEEDIAIAARLPTMPKTVSFKRFAVSPLVFIAPESSELFTPKIHESNKSLFQRIPLIVSEKGLARERLDAWFRKNEISPNIYAQVAGNEAIVSMVSLGLGVGLVPKIVIDNSPLANKVRSYEHQLTLSDFEVGLCVLEKRLKSPIVDAFWTQVKEQQLK